MEFDYPNASFGANVLATGAKFNYRFKIQGSGPLSLQWEDGSGHSHTGRLVAVYAERMHLTGNLLSVSGRDSIIHNHVDDLPGRGCRIF